MYLKSIEVQGFKSFAQKICFEFHNGITGIVGPNGSGKSNVADAVRWVLGEQSARQLRGGNMQDVIFSGTENRKALSFASVAITLDNADHKLPVSFDEVTVARRLYRSGESEYLINGSGCRLKDIQEMFYDTGIGKEGYSIIGQGQIDRILSGRPEERRELFDEAAGIVKFKRRKNTALKKLDDEKQNLVRVTDILKELERQIGPLEKQAETARIYLGKKEDLKRLDVQMFLAETEHVRIQLEELSEKSRLAKAHLQETSEQSEQAKREYEALEERIGELDRQIGEAREQAQENALRSQQLEGQENLLDEQIRTAKENDTRSQERLLTLEKELKEKAEALEGCVAEKKQIRGSLEEIQSQNKEKEDKIKDLDKTIRACEREIEDGKNEIIEILNRRANTKGKMQRYDTMMEQIEIRKSALHQKALRIKSEETELSGAAEEIRGAHARVTAKIRELSEKSGHITEEIRTCTEQMQELRSRQEAGQDAYHRDASRLESLKNLAERYDGYGNSIRRVMERKGDTPGIRGVVADLIQVDKDYEVAVETALGGSIQNIVTDDEQTAKGLIEYLKKNRYGRATFLPLTSIRSRGGIQQEAVLKEPGVVGVASGLVQTDPQYQELIRYLLGKTLVVRKMDHAIAIGRKYRHSLRMVTLEGESFSPGGSMTGGAYRNSSNLLGRRREIEELTAQVDTHRRELESLQKELETTQEKKSALQKDSAQIQKEIQEENIRQNTLSLQLTQQEEKETQLKDRIRRLERERQEIAVQVQELQADTDSIQKELDASGQEEQEQSIRIEKRQEELGEARREAEEYKKSMEEIHLQYSSLEQKESYLDTDMQRLRQEQKRLRGEQEEIRGNLERAEQEISQKEEEIKKIRADKESADAQAKDSQARMQGHLEEKEKVSGAHRVFFQKREALSEEISLLDKEVFRLDGQIEKLEESQESRIDHMWEEYEITPGNAAQYVPEGEARGREELKKDIARVKDEIRKLGDVNVNAIEDYKELKERHTFLTAQYEDLVTAEKTLLQIIDDLDAGMRRQFAKSFKEIQREFNKAFQELFGGGRGTLELMDDADILEAGIKIISQPPGKKLQNMMQLSGGEKALTAIALLFAIQNLKPSPFCLLDEIEAALDDSNVVRFAQYVHKLTENTQFIIITHRRGTMNAADRLYGITMQEKGVSTLVSVDLVENDLDK